MDVSVLNLKNNAVVAQTVAANAVAKSDTQSAGDVFMDMMKQNASASFSSKETLDSGFIKAAQTQSLKSAKKSDGVKTTEKKTSLPFEKAEKTSSKEPLSLEKDRKTQPVQTAEKPDLSTDKPVQTVGQKIPTTAEDSAEAQEIIIHTDKLVLQVAGGETEISPDTTTVEDFVEQAGAADAELRDTMEKSAGVMNSIVVVAQQIINQTTTVEQPAAVTETAVEGVEAPAAEAEFSAPAAAVETQTAAPETPVKKAEAAQNAPDFKASPDNAEDMTVVPVEKASAPIEAKTADNAVETDGNDSDVSFKSAHSAAGEQPVENKYAVGKTGRHTDATANVQAQKIAQELPTNTAVNIQVETAVEDQPAATVQTVDKAAQEPVPAVSSKPAQQTSDTAESRPAAHYEIAAAVKDGQNAQNNSFNFNGNGETRADTVNVMATAPNATANAQSFSDALKSSSAIEGVSSAQTTGAKPTGDAGMMMNAAPQTLKAKTDGTAGTNAPTAKAPVSTNDLVDQIKVNIAKAAKSGVEKVTVTLKPKELGNIQVSLEIGDDNELKATIIASRASTLELLQKDSSVLQKALSDAGFKLNDNALNFSYRGEQQSNAQQFADNNSNRRFSQNGNEYAAATESAVSETVGQQADLTEAIIASQWSAGRHALNIRI